MEAVVVLFNRDLRVHDHPALAEACASARHVVPLFVLDPAIEARHRRDFLHACLHDLRSSLRTLGGNLVVRHGDPVAQAVRLAQETGASAIWASEDVSSLARRRERRLAAECETHRLEFRLFPGVTVVPPGALTPGSSGSNHYRVFSPYWRAWSGTAHRPVLGAPHRLRLPPGVEPGELPALPPEPYGIVRGGESEGRRRLDHWVRHGLASYAADRDRMAGRTSMLSAYLHFGCVSPSEVVERACERPGGEEYVRQLCWRDFHYQVVNDFPEMGRRDYRDRDVEWRRDEDAEAAWREGVTGVPIVDAGMRQLRAEGWMHNRVRLITGSYLTKRLGIDWRAGLAHFGEWLVDGDMANNSGNWQWVAGTGNDTRPYRTLNPLRQAKKFDPEGEYVRRYVPELASLPDDLVQEPWKVRGGVPGYPASPLGGELTA
ncbi:cryptochrome/photolyase family protein [Microbispora triticiradicis]|uniref:Deoxyribodipyrimidine photo-lyase n=2 Tax=Microbispora TaxID=2005 RepID=A0ABY3M2P4_9ACTN|nr:MULTISPECIES: deoxyribodipyrimidine photo-lyase [Microbispora]TLP57743.1 deoxyribodipyrimidine photo-lyase [Microbispora fusca]TYB64661.1 deoxyribodipyrimidine photo-lyase [Microbispora tritici]